MTTSHSVWYQAFLTTQATLQNSSSNMQGIGGLEHQFTQMVLNQFGRNLNFLTTIEDSITNTGKKIDVTMKGHGTKIACEVPVSSKYKEVPNIQKCLDAGYDYVISVSLHKDVLVLVEKAVEESIPRNYHHKILYLFPEDVEKFLEQISSTGRAVIKKKEKVVFGYRVKTQVVSSSLEEANKRRQTLARIIANQILSYQ